MPTGAVLNVFILLAALLGGVAISAQGMINGRLNMLLGSPIQAALISFSVGWLVLLSVSMVSGVGLPSPSRFAGAPWWIFLGGVAGAYMVASTSFGVPRIGSAAWISGVLTGQLLAALLFDHIGAFGQAVRPVTLEKLAGIAALLTGVWLIRK